MSAAAPPWERLRQAVGTAEPRLRALSDDESARPPGPGRWSPRQVLGHLVDSASHNHHRFVRGTWQDDLVFSGYAQDAWVDAQRYDTVPWSDLVTLWVAYNRHIAHVMAVVPAAVRDRVHHRHSLDEITFRRPATPRDATLSYLFADYVEHLEHHLRQILGASAPS